MRCVPAVVSALFCLPVLCAGATGESTEPPISLGGFYYECARAFGIELPEGWEKSKSWMLLRAAGLEVDDKADLEQPLRQKDVIAIATQLGIRLSTSKPEEPFRRKQVEAFLTRFQEHFRLPLRRVKPDESDPDSQGSS